MSACTKCGGLADVSGICGRCRTALDKGGKFDGQKNRLELLPVRAMEALGQVYTYGGRKYSDYNWRKGMHWSRCYGAALRHLFAFWRGEEKDAESRMPHLAHAAWCVLALLEYSLLREFADMDDRPPVRDMNEDGALEMTYATVEEGIDGNPV